MAWLPYAAWFLGGAFLTNAVPHFVSGVMGRPFQSPFATPHGVGLSSSTVNVLWGCFNLAVGYVLLCRVGNFDLRSTADAIAAGLGMSLTGVLTARMFGRLHGGNDPARGE
ncbi:hypothetical protein B0E46_07075 [Rhodanobacter sp. B04]|uniref:hypothetical protein n=1 Tax=Rhodanobacter sp. B04 TaxID=1945860 RepID=UPI0009849B61|nr:hypothetical protein [Rhodanobacter sp. B04]OOG64414.1 hypothetical protein B0E46_07075 [Rhodanobacter sp. B04]